MTVLFKRTNDFDSASPNLSDRTVYKGQIPDTPHLSASVIRMELHLDNASKQSA